tara:strand:+ start:1088 stop:5287 length:4200 start_codon:yes stop_codon:yes gene_type:complete
MFSKKEKTSSVPGNTGNSGNKSPPIMKPILILAAIFALVWAGFHFSSGSDNTGGDNSERNAAGGSPPRTNPDGENYGWSTEYISPENNDMKICNKDECIPCSSHKDCNKDWTESMGDNFVNKCVPREHHRSHGRKRKCAGCEKHEKFCECNSEGASIVNFKIGEKNGYDNEGHPIYTKESLEPLCLKDINIDDKDEIGDKYCNDMTYIKNKFMDYNVFDISSRDIYSQSGGPSLNLKDMEIIKVREPFDIGKPISEFHDNYSSVDFGSYVYPEFERTNKDFFNCKCQSSPNGPPKYQMDKGLGEDIINNIYCKHTSDLDHIKYKNSGEKNLRINLSLDENKVETINKTGEAEMRLDEILFNPEGEKIVINNKSDFETYFRCSDESKELYQINESSPHMATCSFIHGGIQLPYKCMDRCSEKHLIIPEESMEIKDGQTKQNFEDYLIKNIENDKIYKGIPVSDYLQCKPEYQEMQNFNLACLNINSSPLFNIDAMCKKLDNCEDYYIQNGYTEYPVKAHDKKCGSLASPCSEICPQTDFQCTDEKLQELCEDPIYDGENDTIKQYSIGNNIGVKGKYMCCKGNSLSNFYNSTVNKENNFCASPLNSLYNILYKLNSVPIIDPSEEIINKSNFVNVPDDIANGYLIHTSNKSLPFCFRTCKNENIKCGEDKLNIENKPLPINASPGYDFTQQCCIPVKTLNKYGKFEGDPNKIYENHYKNLISSGYDEEYFYDGELGQIKMQGMCKDDYSYMGGIRNDRFLEQLGFNSESKFKQLNQIINPGSSKSAVEINSSEYDNICYKLRDVGECVGKDGFCISSPISIKDIGNFDIRNEEYEPVDLKFENSGGHGHPSVSCIMNNTSGNIDIIHEEQSCNVKRIAYKDSKDNIIEKNQFKKDGQFKDCSPPIEIKKDDKEIKSENLIKTNKDRVTYGYYTTCIDGYDKTNFSMINETENNKMCPTNFIPINPRVENCDIKKDKEDCNLDKSCFYNVEKNKCQNLPRATCREIRPPGRVNSGAPGYQQILPSGTSTKDPRVSEINSEPCERKEGEGYFDETHYKSIDYDNRYLIEPNVKNLINCNDDKMKFDLSDLKRDEEYTKFLKQGYNLTSDPLCKPGYILNTTDNDEFICSPCPSIKNINYGILNKCRLNNESRLASPNTITDYDIEKLEPVNEHGRNLCRNFYTFEPNDNMCNPIKCTIPGNMKKGVVSGIEPNDSLDSNKSENILKQKREDNLDDIIYEYQEGEKDTYGGYSFNIPFNQPNSQYYCSNDKYALRDKCFGIHGEGDLKKTPSPPKRFDSPPCNNYIDYTSYYTSKGECLDKDNNHIWFKENSPLGDDKGNGRCVDVNDYKNDSLIEILMDAGFDKSNPSIISKEYNEFLEKNYNVHCWDMFPLRIVPNLDLIL